MTNDQEKGGRRPGRTIGHDALRIMLDHERALFRDMVDRKHYFANADPKQAGAYQTLVQFAPELGQEVIDRWRRANVFADWALEEFRRTYDTSQEVQRDETGRGGDTPQGGLHETD
jgi:hypothetical protein